MVYLIDFENVHEEGFSALGRLGDKDAVYCFFTRNVAKISMSALAGMRSGQLHFIEAESGKQSLDLALVSFLGYLIGTRPQELYYDIVSNDNGFAKVAEFWNKRGNGLRVRIRKTTDMKPKAEPVKVQALPAATEESTAKTEAAPVAPAAAEAKQESGRPGQNKTRGRQRSQRQRGARQEQQANAAAAPAAAPAPATATPAPAAAPAPATATPASAADSVPAASSAPAAVTSSAPEAAPAVDAATLSALETAGISAAAAEFIQAQAEKYRSDKNSKQLVYRAVVKKYGQKTGTQIYNSAKKLLLK